MKTKELNKEQTIELIDYLKKRIEFNNQLNKEVRKFRKTNNITRETFNGYWDSPSPEMINFMVNFINEGGCFLTDADKKEYLKNTSAIMGQVYSCAVNTYILKDLHDLEAHLNTISAAEERVEEENPFFRVERDLENNRLNLHFDSIPDEEVRTALKSRGFKWSRYLSAWTRQLTPNAEASLNRLIVDLNNLEK